jgi:hypothetical protein
MPPGVRIDAQTARLKMYLDYALSGLRYSTGNTSNNAQNALNAFGTLEAIDNWLFLDFSGNISQQIINPFGVQSPNNSYNNRNLTETSTYRLSPYIRGQLGGSADYFLRYNGSVTNYQSGSLSDVSISQWLGQVRGNTTFQNLNWTIDGSQQNTDYSRGRDYEDGRLRGILTYRLFPEFRISGSGGWETNNYQSLDNEGQSTYGYGLDWTPTERTQVSGFQERRFFGNGHNVLISHRFPLSSIRYTDIRDISLIPNQSSTVGLGTVYDQYFDQFATLIPHVRILLRADQQALPAQPRPQLLLRQQAAPPRQGLPGVRRLAQRRLHRHHRRDRCRQDHAAARADRRPARHQCGRRPPGHHPAGCRRHLRMVGAAFGFKRQGCAQERAADHARGLPDQPDQQGQALPADRRRGAEPHARAVEELRMLSNFQFGNQALLQSFLVGQPEFREILQRPEMEQFRQRVAATCHIGPLDQDETQGYIEHRLKCAGSTGKPSFERRGLRSHLQGQRRHPAAHQLGV